MSLTCIGNDKQKHEIGWIRGQRAYVAATTVCDRKMLPVLQAMPKKSPVVLETTEGVLCSGKSSVVTRLNSNLFGGSRAGGIAGSNLNGIAPFESYSAFMMGGADEISPPGFFDGKINYLINYTDLVLTWSLIGVVENGDFTALEYSTTVDHYNLSFRDDGRGLGAANAVNFLNYIMDQYTSLQTRFETSFGSKIFTNYHVNETFAITIQETSNYHTQDITYSISAENEKIVDFINGGIVEWSAL